LLTRLLQNLIAALPNIVATAEINVRRLAAKVDRGPSDARIELALAGWAGEIKIGDVDDPRFRFGGNGRSDEQAGSESGERENGELGHVASPL
jgi:hypothetical protein